MYPDICYVNSNNAVLDLTSFPYLVNDINEITDYSWDYEANDAQKVVSFSRGVCEMPVTINIHANTHEEYVQARKKLFEVLETDVLNNARGRLYYHGQYVLCNAVTSKKKDWNMGVDFALVYIKFVTDWPYWITEETFEYLPYSGAESKSIGGQNYPYNYPHNYTNTQKGNGIIRNEHYADCNFSMTIYGKSLNPRVSIGGHVYEVLTSVDDGEYMVIDSKSKTIKRYKANKQVVNEFGSRNMESSVFQLIPTGKSNVLWDGSFGIDITLYHERSELLLI